MPDDQTEDQDAEQQDQRPQSLAEALRQGVRDAGTEGIITALADIDGPSRAAVVLLAVGSEASASVLRQLAPIEVQRISSKLASVRALPRELVLEVLREFKRTTSDDSQVAFDTDVFLQNMLQKALGSEGASDLLGKLETVIDMSGVEALKTMEPDVLYEMIKNEHPQIVATVMVFLDPLHAASVAKLFPDSVRDELLLRVALLQKVQPAALKELNEVMSRSLENTSDTRRSTVGGVTPTAEILNYLGGGADKKALEKIREYDEVLAQQIIEQMFTFEDLVEIEDRAMQTLLLEVGQETLVIALKGASPGLRDKVFKNMARRAAEAVREDLETRGPTKIQDVEDQQKEMLRIAREMADEGRINLERGTKADQYI